MPNMPEAESTGILIVWADVPPAIESDFNDWYNHEHLPDRILRMPGFLRGRRYVATAQVAGAPKFLTFYDLQNTAVMLSEAHTTLRKQRTARDQQFVPQFRNTIKGICDVVCRAGVGEGDVLLVLPVVVDAAHDEDFSRRLCSRLLPDLASAPGVASALYAKRNAAITQASSAKDDRAGDRYVESLIVIESRGESGVAAAVAGLTAERLAAIGGTPQWMAEPCVMRLTYTLRKPAAG